MIGPIETAMTDKLNELAKTNAFKVKAESYGGELTDEFLKDAAQKAPAIWIVFAGMTPKKKMRHGSIDYEASFVVISCAKSMHQEAARKGARGGKVLGAYELIMFSISALEGLEPEGVSRALAPGRVANLFNAKANDEHLAIYSVAFTCRFIWDRAVDGDLDDFLTLYHSTKPKLGDADNTDTQSLNSEIVQDKEQEESV
ncbi:phage protein Gp37 [Terasakiella sp. A23]|uniref:phage protein Gp37 n=1 Tax=Terasakiella sp. FCG-A23 TaxID=3080561 RepID=UPI0029544CAD|nr:phage protein Gp37 [Terasakiella sp. A23]MDV7340974.1 phage protein Gp37 [Terasakiella sp. A23]